MNLVVGSTGSIGSAVVDELVSRGEPVRALVRNRNKAERIFRQALKVEFLEGSAENSESLKHAFEGVSDVFNCLNLPYPEEERLLGIHRLIL